MRKVMVMEFKNGELAEKGEAVFHQFGVDYDECDSGYGNYSTAIIEWADGTVENVPVQNIRFLDAAAA